MSPDDLFELKRSWLPLDRRSIRFESFYSLSRITFSQFILFRDLSSPWLDDNETVEMRKRMDFPWQFDGELGIPKQKHYFKSSYCRGLRI